MSTTVLAMVPARVTVAVKSCAGRGWVGCAAGSECEASNWAVLKGCVAGSSVMVGLEDAGGGGGGEGMEEL